MTKRKNPEDKKQAGRPRIEFSEGVITLLEQLEGTAATVTDVCKHLNIGSHVYYLWLKEEPAFSEALTRVRAKVDDLVENALLRRALGYRYTEIMNRSEGGENPKEITAETMKELAPDPHSAMLWLKNRRPDQWRDKKEIEITDHVALLEKYLKEAEGDT